MNCDKSYNKYNVEYDVEYDYDNKNNYNFITKKNNHIQNYKNNEKDKNINLFQNKIEELFLKLKFLNSNKKNLSSDVYNNIDDAIYNTEIYCDTKNVNLNIITLIDNVILKLDKVIVSRGQIIRNDNVKHEK